jgi:hypothetical protein
VLVSLGDVAEEPEMEGYDSDQFVVDENNKVML